MSEEILKIELAELLQTVRLKRKDGVIIEASDLDRLRDCCTELYCGDKYVSEVLAKFFHLAAQVADKTFPIRVEFAVTLTPKITR